VLRAVHWDYFKILASSTFSKQKTYNEIFLKTQILGSNKTWEKGSFLRQKGACFENFWPFAACYIAEHIQVG